MKVCLIVEGAYPYVNGGVSSWMQGLMLAMPDVEFVVQSIAASPDANLQFHSVDQFLFTKYVYIEVMSTLIKVSVKYMYQIL